MIFYDNYNNNNDNYFKDDVDGNYNNADEDEEYEIGPLIHVACQRLHQPTYQGNHHRYQSSCNRLRHDENKNGPKIAVRMLSRHSRPFFASDGEGLSAVVHD